MLSEQENQSSKKKQLNSYAKYSAIGFQMAAIIGLGCFAGVKLDKLYNQSPLFTTLFSLLSVFLAIYYAIKDFIRKK